MSVRVAADRHPAMSEAGHSRGMFSQAESILITGGTFVANEVSYPNPDSSKDWMNLLRANTSAGAFHNSGERRDAPKCHPHTRVAVNREIMEWVRDVNRAHQFLWIYGPAGTGKSSIAQTIAELCEDEGSLASDFFFSRTVAGRNIDTNLIPTLACQLTVTIPDIRPYIATAIDADTLIFSRSLQTQFDTLILKPIKQLIEADRGSGRTDGRPYPYLIIIDGLDECGTPESQLYILSSLSSTLNKSSAIPLIFIIASRPEQVIRDAFNGILNTRTRRIVLDNKYEPDADIRLFLDSKFSDIKRTHLMSESLAADWPLPSEVDYLVQKASGQFIYAATVMKFIASPKARPVKALNIVLKLSSPGIYTPFADLDALYRHILLSLDEADLEKALIVFAFIFLTSTIRVASPFGYTIYRTPTVIDNFLGYELGEVSMVMSDLHSIVSVPPWSNSNAFSAELHFYHASLGDFLQDKSRSESLFIDAGKYSAQFSRICIEHLSPWLDSEALPSLDDCTGAIRYSCYVFLEIFIHARSEEDLLEKLRHFPIKKFIQSVFSFEKDPVLKQDILRRLPALFDWIQKQENGAELHEVYRGHYDDCLKSRLLSDLVSSHPNWRHVLTALTLDHENNEATKYFWRLCFILDKSDTLGKHLLSLSIAMSDRSQPHDYLDYYIPRLIKALVNPQKIQMENYYYVDKSEYIKLAMELFDCLTLEKKKTGNGLHHDDWGLPLDLFDATLAQIPGEQELGQYLLSKKHRRSHDGIYTRATEFQSLVDRYIEDCNLHEEQSALARITFPVAALYRAVINHTVAGTVMSDFRSLSPGVLPVTPYRSNTVHLSHNMNSDGQKAVSEISAAPRERDSPTSARADTNNALSRFYPAKLSHPPAPLIAAHTRDRPLISSTFGSRGFGIAQQIGLATSSSHLRQSEPTRHLIMESLATSKAQLDRFPPPPSLLTHAPRINPLSEDPGPIRRVSDYVKTVFDP